MKKKLFMPVLLFVLTFVLFGCDKVKVNFNTTTTSLVSTNTTTTNPVTSTTATPVTTTTSTTGEKGSFPLTILTVNDLHGYIKQDDNGKNGISNMAYLIDQIRNEDTLDDTVLLANGDMFQGTAISNMTQGKAVLDCMNAMGFDAMGIGNHEFDWGIDTILQYFDGDSSNDEANFPLINDNIYLNSDDSLLTVDGGNVTQSVMLDKGGVKVGIISYIGNVYSSIQYDKVENYHFDEDIADSVKQRATTLRNNGADIVIVNIHGAGSNINNYTNNVDIAQLKDNNGKYLVDMVINGHTHQFQQGAITRTNGEPMPVVQAGSYDRAFGEVTLNINLENMDVTSYSEDLVDVSTAGTNYDHAVQAIVDKYNAQIGNKVLAKAGETITMTSQLQDWSGNVMLKATGADIAVSNTEGIRATGDIKAGEDVTINQLYQISPFDNNIYLLHVTYSQIKPLLDNKKIFYQLANGVSLEPGKTYTVAVISYVYFWDELQDVRSDNDIDTGLYIRDILVQDIEQKGTDGQTFSPISHPEASINQLYYPSN